MRALVHALRRPVVFAMILLLALISIAEQRARAQEAPMRWDGWFELISARNDYEPPSPVPPLIANAPNHVSRHPISADGHFVVFGSDATNFVYGGPALYLRDRTTGRTEPFFPYSHEASISGDGNFVALETCDPGMRPDYAPICDVWSYDRRTNMTAPLSTTEDGWFGDDESSDPVLSNNGRFAVFVTKATILSRGEPGVKQIVLRDRDADGNGIFDEPGSVVLDTISRSPSTGAPGDADSDTPEVSDDGRFVAFRSLASNLVYGDTNGTWDVFLHDRQTGDTFRLNVGPERQQSMSSIGWGQLSMSGDGRIIAFASEDGLLAPASQDDTNGALDVFVYDQAQPWSLKRVDIMLGWPIAGGYILGNGPTSWPRVSADGRYIALQSRVTRPGEPPSDRDQVYVVDQMLDAPQRISVKSSGEDPDQECTHPAISADGSVVLFMSKAANLVPFDGAAADEQLFAAAHVEVTPWAVAYPWRGGTTTFTVTAQQHTRWWADWRNNPPPQWFFPVYIETGVGNGTLTFSADQSADAASRIATIQVGETMIMATQEARMGLTSVSPTSGPLSGGTRVTITGHGFEPGMVSSLGPVEFINASTLIVVTDPSPQPGWVPISLSTADWAASAWMDNAFRYRDLTPPQIIGSVDGPQGQNGWYIGDVTVSWHVADPETQITSTACPTVAVRQDTPGTTYTCSATSDGGTSVASITVRRDTVSPTAIITSPVSTIYPAGALVTPEFTCADTTSGVVSCTGDTNGNPIDTSIPGYHTFSVSAIDQAGNSGLKQVEYAVPTGACAYPMPGLVGWWRFEADTINWMNSGLYASTRVGLTSDVFVDGAVGQGYQFEGADGYINTNFGLRWWGDMKFAMVAWVKPSANTQGTILRRDGSYALARLGNGHLAWAFGRSSTYDLTYYDTGVAVPLNAWTHVAVVLDYTTVRSYVNGRLVHTRTNIEYPEYQGDLITIGGAKGRSEYFKGVIDEVQIFEHGLDGQQVEQLFLSGPEGACVHKHTAFEVVSPIPAAYGDETYAVDARLVDDTGAPVAGRRVEITSSVGAWPPSMSYGHLVTDLDGRVHWEAPVHGASLGVYDDGVHVTFEGDTEYTRLTVERDVVVGKGTPRITWPTPAPITFGTSLSGTQLNATANIPGTFSYSPDRGRNLDAGVQTLTTTFTPTDWDNYNIVSASVLLTVNRAPSSIVVAGGSFVYDGAAHRATGSVRNQWNYVIGTPTFTYNGSPDPPVNVGTYQVVATYDGSGNYEPAAPATATLTISKASPQVTVAGGSFIYDGQPHSATATVTGIGGATLGPVTLTYNGSPEPPTGGGTYEVIASFAGDANHAAATGTGTLVIQRASPVLTWNMPAAIVYGTPLGGSQLNATASIPGSFTYSPGAGTVLSGGAGQMLTAIFTPDEALNYTSASVSTRIDVGRATAVIAATGATFVYDGQPHAATGTVTGLGGATLGPLTFTYNGAANPPVNAGSYEVVASFAGNSDYEPASATASVTITKADVVLSWTAPGSIVYGTPLGAWQLHATANVAGTFSYAPAPGTVLAAGPSHPLTATFTPADTVNYAGGSVATTIAVAPAPLTVRANDVAKPFGAPLPPFSASLAGFVNGDSPAVLSGMLLFSTTATQTSAVGTYYVTPSGLSSPNYAISFASGILTIVKAAVSVAVSSSPEPSGFGMAMKFSATVAPAAPATGAPAGNVRFYLDHTTLLGIVAVSDGAATLATAGLDAGSHTIVAEYDGDASFAAGTASAPHVINGSAATPSLSVSSSKNPSGGGQTVTLEATVTMATGPVSGAVAFYDGATLIGSAAIASGRATLLTAALTPG